MFRGLHTTRNNLEHWLIDILRVAYDRKYICTVMVIDVSRVAFDQKHDIEIHLYHFAGSVQQERHRDYKQKVALRLYIQSVFAVPTTGEFHAIDSY